MLEWRRQDVTSCASRGFARVSARRLAVALATVTCLLIGPAATSAAAGPPVNNLRPEVVGNPRVGERLVCGSGSWSGGVSEFRYQWLRDGVAVGSGVTYQVTGADRGHTIWCVVTAIGAGGRAEAQSFNSLLIEGGTTPWLITAPEVSGTPAVGETLSCSTGTWG